MSLPGGPQMNKFEQVSSDHHQMSLAGVPMSDGWPYPTWHFLRGTPPCDLSHDALDVISPTCKQTDACEHILLRVVTILFSKLKFDHWPLILCWKGIYNIAKHMKVNFEHLIDIPIMERGTSVILFYQREALAPVNLLRWDRFLN